MDSSKPFVQAKLTTYPPVGILLMWEPMLRLDPAPSDCSALYSPTFARAQGLPFRSRCYKRSREEI